MQKYEEYLRLNESCKSIRTDCEHLSLKISGSSDLISAVNGYLEVNRNFILKDCATHLLKKRDKALIEAEEELRTLLKHIEDIKDVPNKPNS